MQTAWRAGTVARRAEAALAQIEPERDRAGVTLPGPDIGPELKLHGDRLRLEQALVNLLRNAIQAAPGGRVRLGASAAGGRVHLTVEDDGPGVDAATRQRLFEPFFTTKPSGHGTGLGLAVVEAVVDEHGGRVTVESSELGGALFRLSFPEPPGEQTQAP
jgi:signal transduction histidine kinase